MISLQEFWSSGFSRNLIIYNCLFFPARSFLPCLIYILLRKIGVTFWIFYFKSVAIFGFFDIHSIRRSPTALSICRFLIVWSSFLRTVHSYDRHFTCNLYGKNIFWEIQYIAIIFWWIFKTSSAMKSLCVNHYTQMNVFFFYFFFLNR
jgi:hypothetical protein